MAQISKIQEVETPRRNTVAARRCTQYTVYVVTTAAERAKCSLQVCLASATAAQRWAVLSRIARTVRL